MSNIYLKDKFLESVIDKILNEYDLNFEIIDEKFLNEVFNEFHDFIQENHESQLALINESENHSFYETIEIPAQKYIKEKIKSGTQ